DRTSEAVGPCFKPMKASTWVKANRIRRGWTQADLASMAGLSRETIGLIEREKTDPDDLTVAKIAAAFRVEFGIIDDTPKVLEPDRPDPFAWIRADPAAFGRAVADLVQVGPDAAKALEDLRKRRAKEEQK